MGPFIMNPEGVGRLFAPLAAFADGPFPEHYEPIESPDRQSRCIRPQSTNPVVRKYESPLDKLRRAPVAGSTSSAPPTA